MSTNIVASVTMKLGSRVQVTSIPFMNPMPTAKTSTARNASQKFQPNSETRMPSSSPVEPVMTPLERSTSPEIMSSETAHAMIP